MNATLIIGGGHTDDRGTLRFINDFDMTDVKRFYSITHPDTSVVRAWQGHKVEKKWFFCTAGSFRVSVIKVDDWDNPSVDLVADEFELSGDEPQVLVIPAGCANGFQALEANSTLMVYSNLTLEEGADDNHRFPVDTWKR